MPLTAKLSFPRLFLMKCIHLVLLSLLTECWNLALSAKNQEQHFSLKNKFKFKIVKLIVKLNWSWSSCLNVNYVLLISIIVLICINIFSLSEEYFVIQSAYKTKVGTCCQRIFVHTSPDLYMAIHIG